VHEGDAAPAGELQDEPAKKTAPNDQL
ncbi:MAG: hypothetical protein JWM53_1431, partial [bacterium]|nr:hypothetical protein [bacterium]